MFCGSVDLSRMDTKYGDNSELSNTETEFGDKNRLFYDDDPFTDKEIQYRLKAFDR